MPNQDLGQFVASVITHLKARGEQSVQAWMTSVEAGNGGDLLLRAPAASKTKNNNEGQEEHGPARIAPEAWYRSENFPS